MATADATSLPVKDRALILDVLRGFALLGVLLDNLFAFTGWGNVTQEHREALSTWPADGILGLLELAFVHGKFYSVFSLLFGIGFSIIMIRNEEKGVNPYRIFYRRLLVLLAIGAFHLRFLWEGDILFLYASLGMLLPLFRKLSDKALIIWAAALILSPVLIDALKVAFQFKTGVFLENMAKSVDARTGLPADDGWRTYLFNEGSGWKEWRNWQASGYFYRYAYIIESNRIPKVLGMFLLGLLAGRKLIYLQMHAYLPFFKSLRKWGFIIGIPASLAMAYFEIDGKHIPQAAGLLDSLSYALGVVPLSLAYVATICLVWVRSHANTKLKVLAPLGQMALTNYLVQTILGVIIYYGVGFGFGGKVGPVIFFPAGLAVYGLQILYSQWWMKRFNYGPLEWVWRQLTYAKRLPLLKEKTVYLTSPVTTDTTGNVVKP